VGVEAGLDGYGKPRPYRGSNLGPSNPQLVAISITLSRPPKSMSNRTISNFIWKFSTAFTAPLKNRSWSVQLDEEIPHRISSRMDNKYGK
jgi:hypothetical protein